MDTIKPLHFCPNCGKDASKGKAAVKEFGCRQLDNKTIALQSWCKKCRAIKKETLDVRRYLYKQGELYVAQLKGVTTHAL